MDLRKDPKLDHFVFSNAKPAAKGADPLDPEYLGPDPVQFHPEAPILRPEHRVYAPVII